MSNLHSFRDYGNPRPQQGRQPQQGQQPQQGEEGPGFMEGLQGAALEEQMRLAE